MNAPLKRYRVWDRTTRVFHWVNALTVILLMIFGTVILNAKGLGITGDAKILLKELHVIVGYVFAINLFWRLVWAFIGNRFARWGSILPIGSDYRQSFSAYIASLKSSEPQQYLGHNPVARLIVALFLLLLSIQAGTGLVVAGTDIYYPPFGNYFAEWVTEGDSERLAVLKPGDKTHVVDAAYKEMRDFRKPFITVHYYLFFVLLGLIFIHIGGVVVTEVKERNGLISAMITGEKVLDKEPVDKA